MENVIEMLYSNDIPNIVAIKIKREININPLARLANRTYTT